MIARNPEQRVAYEARIKLERDEAARLDFARSEGLQKGEQIGRQKGEQIGKIHLLEELLGIPQTNVQDFENVDAAELIARRDALQQQLRNRNS